MEALEFLKTAKRRYESDKYVYGSSIYLMSTNIEKYVSDVEKWAKEHPAKTRQTEFLKMFPNVPLTDSGFVDIPPCILDKKSYEWCNTSVVDCRECYEQFWNEEVE